MDKTQTICKLCTRVAQNLLLQKVKAQKKNKTKKNTRPSFWHLCINGALIVSQKRDEPQHMLIMAGYINHNLLTQYLSCGPYINDREKKTTKKKIHQ